MGNRTIGHSAWVVRLCLRFSVPCLLENPVGSRLFQAPRMTRLIKHDHCQRFVLDMCAFGARWRKRTCILAWCSPGAKSSLNSRCTGHAGKCSFSGDYHVVLAGAGPHGKLWTSVAQEYPKGLARALAGSLIQSFKMHSLAAMQSRL